MAVSHVTHNKCIELLEKIEDRASELTKKTKNCEAICKKIHQELKEVEKSTEEIFEKHSGFHEKLKAEILQAIEKSNKAHDKLQSETKKMREFTIEVSGLESKIRDFSREIHEVETSIDSVRRQIEDEEKIRFDASHEWIPGVTFIKGLFTGDVEKTTNGLIPGYNFYQAARGIVSHISKEKERLEIVFDSKRCSQESLLQQKNFVDNQLKETQKVIENLTSERDFFFQYHELLERKKKLLWPRLTVLTNIRKDLKIGLERCGLLKNRVGLFPLFAKRKTLKQEIPDFLNKCRQIKINFASTQKFHISDLEKLNEEIAKLKRCYKFAAD